MRWIAHRILPEGTRYEGMKCESCAKKIKVGDDFCQFPDANHVAHYACALEQLDEDPADPS